MKRLAVFVVLILGLLPSARAQENPDDQYLIIYALMQQADAFDNSGEPRRALNDYVEAQNSLQKFHTAFPDWSPKIINFRLDYLAEKIAETTAKLPPVPQAGTPAPVVPAPATTRCAAPGRRGGQRRTGIATRRPARADQTAANRQRNVAGQIEGGPGGAAGDGVTGRICPGPGATPVFDEGK